MKQVLLRQGSAVVEDVPAPLVEPGTVLVRVQRSCISIGSEVSGMRASGTTLLERARREPERVKIVGRMVLADGFSKTRKRIQAKLRSGHAVGYSAAGMVIEVGEGIEDLRVGDRVACAGAQCAHHAEVIRVPRNLSVPIADTVDFEEASTVALGAIALQGVRRAAPALGETFVVVGLGVLGQLTAQLLRVNGCRTIGVDIDEERLSLAKSLALDVAVCPGHENEVQQVQRLTDGDGADGVIVTAASPSDAILSTAFNMCRRKGRVVLVGDVGLKLNRSDIYPKELDFLISTSYGPGRYDSTYEEEGLDYPIAYVRWTENRNMAEYVRLLAERRLQVRPMISTVCPLEDAPRVYDALKEGAKGPLLALLRYPKGEDSGPLSRAVSISHASAAAGDRVRLAVVGAGDFASGTHLPNIHALRRHVELRCVMSRTGHRAAEAARQYGARYSTTDFDAVLNDPEIDAVLIATRHSTHATLALAALTAGKHVLVEKPLALTADELGAIESFFARRAGASPVLLTGFNRRFSPHAKKIAEALCDRSNPMIINYFMNAGHIPSGHWVHGEEGGGRNRGEACHIYDLFTFFTGSAAKRVSVDAIRPATQHYGSFDNFVATVTFEDGSVATLTYTALGTAAFPKETMIIACDGKVLELKDYRQLAGFGIRVGAASRLAPDKGLQAELTAFIDCIRRGGEWPIPLWQQLQATRMANDVESQLESAQETNAGGKAEREGGESLCAR